jgi:putative DNA primase/helicase
MDSNTAFTVHTFPPVNDVVTEDSAAQQFVEQYGDMLRFCHSRGRWLHWDGFYWRINETCLAFHWARELARRLAENQDKSGRKTSGTSRFVAGVEKFARSDPKVSRTILDFDRDPWLLGTPSGTVDLRSGKLRPGRQNDAITKVTSVAPAAIGCPLWLKFLNETTGGDTALIRFLQQWSGYSLTGITREHALVFIYGPGGNGKSVFLNLVTSIIGDYATTAAMETFVASINDRHSTEVAMLAGARCVVASETEEGRAWAEARIKQLTGGDSITARFMRRDNFTFQPQLKLIVIGNHKPILHNVDDAAKRRFNIVPFTRKPAQVDYDLEQKLKAEAPAILQWMIDGAIDWQRNGLIRPPVVLDATAEYFSDQDCFRHWLDADCIVEIGNMDRSATSSELFKSWSAYAKSAGIKAGSTVTFKDCMISAGFKFYRSMTAREFFGVGLRANRVPFDQTTQ